MNYILKLLIHTNPYLLFFLSTLLCFYLPVKKVYTQAFQNGSKINTPTFYQKLLQGSGNESGHAIQNTSDGGFVVVSQLNNSLDYNPQIGVIKFDSAENVIWQKTYGGPHEESGFSINIQQTSDQGFIISGHTRLTPTNLYDIYVLRLDQNGNKIWEKAIGAPLTDVGRTIIQTKDNGFLIGGSSDSFGDGSPDIILIKLNNNGTLDWTKILESDGGEQCTHLQQTNDGGFVITGFQQPSGSGPRKGILIKTDHSAAIEWQKAIAPDLIQEIVKVEQSKDGNIMVLGNTNKSGKNGQQVILAKLDPKGNLKWGKSYGSNNIGRGIYFMETEEKDLLMALNSMTYKDQRSQLILKTDAFGKPVWAKSYAALQWTAFADWGTPLIQLAGGELVFVGWTTGKKNNNEDLLITKAGPVGKLGCTTRNINITEEKRNLKTENTSIKAKNVTPNVINLTNSADNAAIKEILLCKTDTCKRPDPVFELAQDNLCYSDTLSIKNLTNGASKYKWFIDGVLIDTVKSPKIPIKSKNDFLLELKAINGNCDSTITKNISVKPSPQISIDSNQTICEGTSLKLKASGAQNYFWFPNYNISCQNCANPSVSPDSTMTYFVEATNDFGCTTMDSIKITVQSLDFTFSKETSCSGLSTVKFNNISETSENLTWHFGDGNTAKEASPTYRYKKPGTYHVKLQSKDGSCYTVRKIEILPVPTIPNVITPNNDGKNDEFQIEFARASKISLKILNRWGEIVFQNNNYNGTWQANGLPNGYYYYLVTIGPKSCKGWVKVIK